MAFTDNGAVTNDDQTSVTSALPALIVREIAQAGGWLPFDRFMHLALYAPQLGYYAHGSAKFGALPSSGSDFVTAPELSPLFACALAVQVAESLAATGTDEVWEFGAGSGALAAELIAALDALGQPLARYTIVDVLEPFLIQQGFLQRTPRGRVATAAIYRHLGLDAPSSKNQSELWQTP